MIFDNICDVFKGEKKQFLLLSNFNKKGAGDVGRQNNLVLKFELFHPTVRILKNALVWMKDEQKKISLTGV